MLLGGIPFEASYHSHCYNSFLILYVYTILIRIEVRMLIFYKRFLTQGSNESSICSDPDVYFLCSPIRIEWQVLIMVFTSLIAWLKPFMFIKLYGLNDEMLQISASCGKIPTNMTNRL